MSDLTMRHATQAEQEAFARLQAAERELDQARQHVQTITRRERMRSRLTLILHESQHATADNKRR